MYKNDKGLDWVVVIMAQSKEGHGDMTNEEHSEDVEHPFEPQTRMPLVQDTLT